MRRIYISSTVLILIQVAILRMPLKIISLVDNGVMRRDGKFKQKSSDINDFEAEIVSDKNGSPRMKVFNTDNQVLYVDRGSLKWTKYNESNGSLWTYTPVGNDGGLISDRRGNCFTRENYSVSLKDCPINATDWTNDYLFVMHLKKDPKNVERCLRVLEGEKGDISKQDSKNYDGNKTGGSESSPGATSSSKDKDNYASTKDKGRNQDVQKDVKRNGSDEYSSDGEYYRGERPKDGRSGKIDRESKEGGPSDDQDSKSKDSHLDREPPNGYRREEKAPNTKDSYSHENPRKDDYRNREQGSPDARNDYPKKDDYRNRDQGSPDARNDYPKKDDYRNRDQGSPDARNDYPKKDDYRNREQDPPDARNDYPKKDDYRNREQGSSGRRDSSVPENYSNRKSLNDSGNQYSGRDIPQKRNNNFNRNISNLNDPNNGEGQNPNQYTDNALNLLVQLLSKFQQERSQGQLSQNMV